MSTPPFRKEDLKEALPLAATPSPSPSPSSNPEANAAAGKKRLLIDDNEVDELRLGHAPRVNPAAALAEMKAAAAASATAAPFPAPKLAALPPHPPPAAASPSTVVRGQSTYFSTNPPTPSSKKRHLVINTNQEKNYAILKHLAKVPIEWSSTIAPDFIFTPTACGFYLSMRWHLLNKGYIAARVHEVRNYPLRVVLCHVDVEDSAVPIRELSQHCLNLNVTLILAWSHKEAARYIETFKAYEGRPATMLQERVEESEKHADVLQVVRFINKTDVQTLVQSFGTLKRIANASMEELSLCPGLGARKVKKLHAAFTDPLDPVVARRKKETPEIAPFLVGSAPPPPPAAAGVAAAAAAPVAQHDTIDIADISSDV